MKKEVTLPQDPLIRFPYQARSADCSHNW